MYAIDATHHAGRDRGRAVLPALIVVMVVAIAAACVWITTSSRDSSGKEQSRPDKQRAFHVAEGGLEFALARLTESRAWPLRATDRFPTLADDGSLTSNWISLEDGSGEFQLVINYQTLRGVPADWDQPGLPADFQPAANAVITDRANPSMDLDLVHVSVTGRCGESLRAVSADVRFELNVFRSAIVSDSPALSGSLGSGKSAALDHGHVSFAGGNQYVFGGVHANGKIVADGIGQLASSNLADALEVWSGDLKQELYGTEAEIPDFTDPGAADQLFDFERFLAAANAGCGQVISGIDAFHEACDAANRAGSPLEGIIYLKIDAAEEGADPKIDVVGGVNISGTLVVDFTNPPDDFYKVALTCPLNINAAALPDDFDPSKLARHTTGYPATVSAGKDPRGFAIGDDRYDDFAADADMPALVFNTGTVDIHGSANICGAVYSPSFIEIENLANNLQYFNGAILGGSGIYILGKVADNTAQVFIYDASAVDALPTPDGSRTVPAISNYVISE